MQQLDPAGLEEGGEDGVVDVALPVGIAVPDLVDSPPRKMVDSEVVEQWSEEPIGVSASDGDADAGSTFSATARLVNFTVVPGATSNST